MMSDILKPGTFEVVAAVLGLILGSFYNVCVHRYLSGESVVFPGSRCPRCGHPLSWWENIPIVSFIILRGRCRDCRGRISRRYPVVESISCLWALALALRFGPGPAWLGLMAVGGLLIVASFIDFEIFILPDVLTLPAAALALPTAIWGLGMDPLASIGSALAGAGVFLLISLYYEKVRHMDGLGLGDVKLMLSLGALAGPTGLPLAVVGGSVSALLASGYYVLKARRAGEQAGLKTRIPFGPFLTLGGMIAVLYGESFWHWYLGA